jgi:hypothetical protein
MFDRFKRKAPAPPGGALREVLFGDVPLGEWAAAGTGEPWASFRAAAEASTRQDSVAARAALQGVLARPGLESRHYLEAWSGLRALGVAPPDAEAKRVFGVVLDVPLSGGLDTLAAYEDRSARYLNQAGGAVVWDTTGADAGVDARVEAFLAAGRTLAAVIGPWEGARPPLPPDTARVSLLTPSGLHFGQGPLAALSREPIAVPLFEAGTALMQALVERAGGPRGGP